MPETEKRVAAVTGGNRGIGLEACRQLAQQDIRVILTARQIAGGKAAAQKLADQGLDVIFHQLDVTDPVSVDNFVKFINIEIGRLDILVNNAGIFIDKGDKAVSVDLEKVYDTMETNFFGVFRTCQKLIPIMQKQKYGRIVNVSSRMGQLSDMGGSNAAYRISKTALNALTCVLADEVHSQNILVNTMSPGWVRTDMGGPSAHRSVKEGADTITWLATLPDDGPTGRFFADRKEIPW